MDEGWRRTDVGRVRPDGYLALADRAEDAIMAGRERISSVDPGSGVT